MELTVAGKVIGTTEQHPFHVKDRGWVAANELSPGDLLTTDHVEFFAVVEATALTDRVVPVYNLSVEHDHTYFVSYDDWDVAVWAHNTYNKGQPGKQARLRELGSDPNVSRADRGWIQQELNQIARGNRKNIRLPGSSRNGISGKVLAHRRGFEAKNGYSYLFSDLQDVMLHNIQHRWEGY